MITSYSGSTSETPESLRAGKSKLPLIFVFLAIVLLIGVGGFLFWRFRGIGRLSSKSLVEVSGSATGDRKSTPTPVKIGAPGEGSMSLLSVSTCRIVFFNIAPPTTPLERLQEGAKRGLEEVKSAVLAGTGFEVACNKKINELKSQNSDYHGAFSQVAATHSDMLFASNEKNREVGEEVKAMSVGELRIFPFYDGPYLDDDSKENDSVYLSAYFLVRKNEVRARNVE